MLLMTAVGPGCAMTNKLAFKTPSNANKNANAANPKSSSSYIGSAEFSYSNKLKDPVKTNLAYAAWSEQAGNTQEAHAAYAKVLEKNPKNAEGLLGMARVERSIGRDAEADLRLKKALKLHPKDPKVLVAIGQVHASREEWPEALEKMKAAHEIAPFDKVYEYHLAVVEARMGNTSSAIEHFNHAVGQAEAYYNVGFILSEQGRTAEAEKLLMSALKLKPDLKQAETALASMRTSKPSSKNEVQPVSFDERN
jgi:tetratricopeptide (TPR) repeat protein